MKSINLTCDRCKKTETILSEDESKLDLKVVGICVCHDRFQYNGIPVADIKNIQQWCLSCRKEVQIEYQKPEEKEKIKQLTTEEQLLEVLRNFIHEQLPQ